jgi:DNA-binding response OmpR family regulator
MKILIIEDEPLLAQSIQQFLQASGNTCDIANRFALAWMKIGVYQYDCILVDITLPDGNGLDIVRELRTKQSKAGIIIISARNALDDKINGLHLGADDYLPKPFHLSELNARIIAVVRRQAFEHQTAVRFEDIVLNPVDKSVRYRETPLQLTRSEYELLAFFITNKNRVLSKENIAEQLVGDQADMLDNFNFVYSHIKNLRKKLLEAGSPDYLKAVYGVGYKFTSS